MTTNLTTDFAQDSATIYQFPPRGRYAAGARNQAARLADRGVLQPSNAAFGGSGWYHDEAIREERDRKE